MYPQQTSTTTRSNSLPAHRPAWLADVDHLRRTPDEMVAITSAGACFRFTYRNGQMVNVAPDALRWLLKHDCNGIDGNPLPVLALKIARSLFRTCGGKKALGVSFEDWMLCCA